MPLNLNNQALILPINTEFPGTMQDLLDLIAQYLAIAGQADFSGINFGPTTPAPTDQDRPWFKTDNSGNPIGWFTWNGSSWSQLPVVPQSGVFASAPVSGLPGQTYYATDLGTTGTMLIWNGTTWITVDGVSGDIKFVRGTSSAAILANNPGWTLVTDLAAQVPGVAGDGSGGGFSVRAPETTVGEEAHIQTVSEMAPHVHETPAQPAGTANGNAFNPSGGLAVVGAGWDTTSVGGGTAANVMQPTRFLYCIQKT